MIDSILLVEDEKITSDMIGDLLSRFCDNLYVGSNGEEGLMIFEKKRPSLIITDMQMPILNGLEMIKEIRKQDSDVDIICTTAFSGKEFYDSIENLNIKKVFNKPIDLDELVVQLEGKS